MIGVQAYELNKNVRRAWPTNVDYQFLSPVEFTELLGKIKVLVPSLNSSFLFPAHHNSATHLKMFLVAF